MIFNLQKYLYKKKINKKILLFHLMADTLSVDIRTLLILILFFELT